MREAHCSPATRNRPPPTHRATRTKVSCRGHRQSTNAREDRDARCPAALRPGPRKLRSRRKQTQVHTSVPIQFSSGSNWGLCAGRRGCCHFEGSTETGGDAGGSQESSVSWSSCRERLGPAREGTLRCERRKRVVFRFDVMLEKKFTLI